ncbi:MAG TPA: peptidase M23 [Lachnospiraceae bacterium]|nr:peptidase M23 [Lachnospiraceae bacterium]
MKKKKSNYKKYKFTYIKATLGTLFLGLFFLKGYTPFEQTGENFFHIRVNGQDVGTLGDKARIEELLLQARKNVAALSDELVFMETNMEITGEEVLWGETDREEDVTEKMEAALKSSIRETMHRSYTLKINEYTINLASMEEVRQLLQAALDKYGNDGTFVVELRGEEEREFSVLTAGVSDTRHQETEDWHSGVESGVQSFFSGITGETETVGPKDFSDYELGIQSMDFAEDVEIVEVYLPESQLTPLEEAVSLVIMEQETPSIYEVVAGDTLSEIAIRVDIPMDTIIAMNDSLEDENSMLHIGDELLITVPEPELSVNRVEEEYYEEIYDADVIYIDNDSWYTTDMVVRQQPSAGFRKVIADVSYVNDREAGRMILKEEIVMEAVAKVVERGTKIPPTYIKPISGGRLSSGFGRRSRPTKGASSYHKGIDWATPTGTAVYASCGGTVSKAGWGSGYGYVVYIEHEDGRQTRYGHLSKVLVSVGQKVKQGERIALSGNTGVSTGPHIHFEILINGVQVDPLKYLD